VTKKKVSTATTLDERLEALRGQPKEELAALLAELAAAHPEVEERIGRHALAADPPRLAAEFRKRLQNWRRSGRFLWRTARARCDPERSVEIREAARGDVRRVTIVSLFTDALSVARG
jgi:hypothetical protein